MTDLPKASAVERALLILEALDSSRRGLNISELSRRLQIPKSSTHVIVVTLERLGYVQKHPDSLHYRLGLRAYALGQSMTKSLSLSEVALPHMRVLVDQLRLSAHLAVADGDQGVYIQKVESPGLLCVHRLRRSLYHQVRWCARIERGVDEQRTAQSSVHQSSLSCKRHRNFADQPTVAQPQLRSPCAVFTAARRAGWNGERKVGVNVTYR